MAQLHGAAVQITSKRADRTGVLSEQPLQRVAAYAVALVGDDDPLGQICGEHLATGGGMLRAKLALSAAEALGVDEKAAIAWAAACELIHNATLVHDDLQDRDIARRGQPTVWKRHGEAQAINAGDLLLTLPYRAVGLVPVHPGLRWSLTAAVASRAEETVRGQSLEMTLLDRRPWRWRDYAAAAAGKTGALIGLPIEGIALLAGVAPDSAQSLGHVFRDLGFLYQIQDDVTDLFGDKRRGRRGSDFFEGKVTALVVEHARLFPDEESWLYEILSCPATLTSSADIDEIASRLEAGGALSTVLARAVNRSAATRARAPLRMEPRLLPLAEWLASRCLQPLEELFATHFAPKARTGVF